MDKIKLEIRGAKTLDVSHLGNTVNQVVSKAKELLKMETYRIGQINSILEEPKVSKMYLTFRSFRLGKSKSLTVYGATAIGIEILLKKQD